MHKGDLEENQAIAITIDESMLRSVDQIVAEFPEANRSRVIRQAIAEYLKRQERILRETKEREIWNANIDRINAQAAAMIDEQGEP